MFKSWRIPWCVYCGLSQRTSLQGLPFPNLCQKAETVPALGQGCAGRLKWNSAVPQGLGQLVLLMSVAAERTYRSLAGGLSPGLGHAQFCFQDIWLHSWPGQQGEWRGQQGQREVECSPSLQ